MGKKKNRWNDLKKNHDEITEVLSDMENKVGGYNNENSDFCKDLKTFITNVGIVKDNVESQAVRHSYEREGRRVFMTGVVKNDELFDNIQSEYLECTLVLFNLHGNLLDLNERGYENVK